MGNPVQSQIKAADAAKIAEAAIGIGLKIDDSCQKKKKNLENGFRACKGGACAPAKCISFRTRCNQGECG